MKRIRPFPMKGNFFANCFIHFEPYEAIDGTSTYDPTKDIPPYLISGSVFEKEWKSAYPLGWKGVSLCRSFTTLSKLWLQPDLFTIFRFLYLE